MAIDVLELQLASAMQRATPAAACVVRSRSRQAARPVLARARHDPRRTRVAQEQPSSASRRCRPSSCVNASAYWQLFDEAAPGLRGDRAVVRDHRGQPRRRPVVQRQSALSRRQGAGVFVCEERSRFLADISRLATEGRLSELGFKLRPRERAPVDVIATVGADTKGPAG